MIEYNANLTTGVYQYTYPTFADAPQLICVHFITPDRQHAFVTYPNHRHPKLGQLLPISWFNSVIMTRLEEGQSQLMQFLNKVLPALISRKGPKLLVANPSENGLELYDLDTLVAA